MALSALTYQFYLNRASQFDCSLINGLFNLPPGVFGKLAQPWQYPTFLAPLSSFFALFFFTFVFYAELSFQVFFLFERNSKRLKNSLKYHELAP